MITRTGNKKIAVVGWGRGMGHKGHMYLASSVITKASLIGADPYFFISTTVGKDDPLFPEEKVKIYQKVFPQYAKIFQPQSNLNVSLEELAKDGYTGVILVVGADQKEAFQYLVRPSKDGTIPYQKMGFSKFKVISRQETGDASSKLEGPRATPMREVLLHPEASEEQKFEVWRDAMPDALGDKEVMDLMRKAEARLLGSRVKKQKATKLKEFIQRVRPMLKEASPEQKLKVLKMLKEFAPGNGRDDDDKPQAEYEVYQCNPDDEFDWIGGPILKTDNLGTAFTVAYNAHQKYPDRAFMVYQPRLKGSRGGSGLKGYDDDEWLNEAGRGSFRAGDKKRHEVNAMTPEEQKAHDLKRQEQQRKRDDARMERERQKNAAKKGVAEAGFDKAEFNRHMEQLRAREELRKKDPVSAKALDLRDKLPQLTKKKPEDDDTIGPNDYRHPGYGALHNPLPEGELDEARILSPQSKVLVYYKPNQHSSDSGQLLTKPIPLELAQRVINTYVDKYKDQGRNAIGATDFEVRPYNPSQYTRSSLPDLAENQDYLDE